MRAVYTSEFCSLEVDREKRRQWRRLQIQLIRRRRRRRRRLLLLHVAATRINDNLLFSLNQPSFPKLSRLPTRFHDKTIVDCRIDALLITHSTTSMHCKEYLIEKSGRKQKKRIFKNAGREAATWLPYQTVPLLHRALDAGQHLRSEEGLVAESSRTAVVRTAKTRRRLLGNWRVHLRAIIRMTHILL